MNFLNLSNGIYNIKVIKRMKIVSDIIKCYCEGEVINGAYKNKVVREAGEAEATDEVYLFTARIEFTDNEIIEESVYKFFSSQDVLNYELKEKSEAEKKEVLKNMNKIIAFEIAKALNSGSVAIGENTYYNALYNHYNF